MKLLIHISNRSLIGPINYSCQVFFFVKSIKTLFQAGPATRLVNGNGFAPMLSGLPANRRREEHDRDAMRRNRRQSSLLKQQLLFKNEFPEKENVSLSRTRLRLRYNWNPVIIPHWAIGVLVCEQSLRKYLGAVSGFFR